LCGESVQNLSNIEAGKKAIDYIKQLSLDIGAPQRLSEMGLTDEGISEMSQVALEDACMITNPRDIKIEDVIQLYRQAL
jgi:1,3-propanediol dehydrogenase